MKTIFYFTAEWCNPCKRTRPIVEELNRDQSTAKFQIIDVDFNSELVKNFEIKSVPTFILFENGAEIKRVTGGQTREQLEELINYEKTIQEDIQS
jgi:thioredoxin-like negative regulator of GroEL